jgi:NAD(P)H dehydrogenase (quinone)
MKLFLETLGKYGVAGKLGGAFATANYIHGGAELAMQTILDHMLVYGMLVYSGGGSQGKPVIHLGPQAVAGRLEETEETFRLYGQRMAAKAAELFG